MQGGDIDPTGEDLPSRPDEALPSTGTTPSADATPPLGTASTQEDVTTSADVFASVPAADALAAAPGEGSTSVATVPPPPDSTDPVLPQHEAKKPPPVTSDAVTPTRGAETWYRTDQDRFRSVHRRANPWYRRLARGVIGLAFLAAAGIGLFYGARLVQDYLDRDKLPDQGADVPEIRATSFEIRSTTPAPVLDGTLTLDAETKAFEFIGRGTGPQAGIQVVSLDGSTVLIRRGVNEWETPGAADQVAADARRAAAYLADDDSADDILTSQLRRGYVDLIDRVEIGEGDDELRRYEMRLDTDSFRDAYPLQYQNFEDQAIPGVQPVRGLLVNITLDDQQVLVAVEDMGTNWSWQRLTYSDQPFTPGDPADAPFGDIEISDGTIGG
jgi:hypothetical protein